VNVRLGSLRYSKGVILGGKVSYLSTVLVEETLHDR
jgi:hypothetical protein